MNPAVTVAATWVYFLTGLEPGHQERYEVLDVIPVCGRSSIRIEPGTVLTRMEAPVSIADFEYEVKFKGNVRHLQYTPSGLRSELQKKSAGPLPGGENTLAVLIPIRKSEAWWSLSQDERQKHFEKNHSRNHAAVGLDYADRIYRKLYHARYSEVRPPLEYDFLTYFEFRGVFENLLKELRDRTQNPEWQFVDFELEVWMNKTGKADLK